MDAMATFLPRASTGVAGLDDVLGSGLARNRDRSSPGLQMEFTVEDPGVFTTPWSAAIVYRRPLGNWPSMVCAENNSDYLGRSIKLPRAGRPDF